MREIKNAQITGTMLGTEDHGIMTAFLYLDYGDSSQGFGGYGLDAYNQKEKKRISHRTCGEFIMRVLETVGVEKWEDLKGKYIKADSSQEKVHGICNILDIEKWYYPEEEFKNRGDEWK